ncbi:MAG: hypothetical protein ACE368_06515 [Paracoccaceae bacterium]
MLIRIADCTLDRVIWRDEDGIWIESSNLQEAVKTQKARRNAPFLPVRALRKASQRLGLRRSFKEKVLFLGEADLAYDVYEEGKPLVKDITIPTNFQRKFSICHGIDIIDGGRVPKSLPNFKKHVSILQPFAFLFSELERYYYEETYELSSELLSVVGIPRHEPAWIDRLQAEDESEIAKLPNRFIGLISRPHNANYLPVDRKIRALKALKAVASELGIPIVLKRHPKQKHHQHERPREEEFYESIFGAAEFGKDWFETKAHWLALGPRCVFALSFYSGVVTDMAVLGVPTVEWLDLKGLPKYDNDFALREPDGTPVFSYRYLGLVAGETTEAGLRQFALRALENRHDTAGPMVARYRDIFGDPTGAISRVVNQICL